jgi:hypothetical protein
MQLFAIELHLCTFAAKRRVPMSPLLKRFYSISLLITVLLFIGGQQLHCYAGHDQLKRSGAPGLYASHHDCIFCSVSIQLEDHQSPEFSPSVISSEFINPCFYSSETVYSNCFYFSLRAPPISA